MSQHHTSLPDLIEAYDRARRPDVKATILGRFVVQAMAEAAEQERECLRMCPSWWRRTLRRLSRAIRKKHQ